MGNSYIAFRGRDFRAKDWILEVWLRCVALHLEENNVYLEDHWSHAFRNDLLFSSAGMMTGLIFANLDRYCTDDARVSTVLAASDRAMDRLRDFGASLPRAFMNAIGIVGTVYTADVPLSQFEELHDTFNALLRGQLKESPRMLPTPLLGNSTDASSTPGSA